MDVARGRYTEMKNVSYLRARDPSIVTTWGYRLGPDVRRNLNSQLYDTIQRSSNSTKDDGLLQVYLRIKKTADFKDLYEIINDDALLCKVPEGAQCIRNLRDGSIVTKTFKFSKIFGSESLQIDLFNGVIKEKVLRFINGYNCNLLTYGASGSGKTFTIVGTAEEPGAIPRALEYFFRTLPQLPELSRIKPTSSGGIVLLTELQCEQERMGRETLLKNSNAKNTDRAQHTRTYKAMQQRLSEEPVALIMDDISDVSLGVWVSFAEIYNEYVYDLLKPEPPRGQARQKLNLGHCKGSTYIKNLTCVNVSSGLQAYQILQYGLHNLKYAATSLNDHSSRSHSIFTIKLAQASDTEAAGSVSLFNFCDLAGSERVNKTHNAGERLIESNNINTSLLVLGRCVSLVRESQKRSDNRLIPFRESKLTQLFQNALLGNEVVSMIVNINPIRDMFDETQHVLNFSAIAKDVVIKKQNLLKPPSTSRFSQYLECKGTIVQPTLDESELEELQEQVASLYSELQQQKVNMNTDREHVISTYKRILANTNAFWEDRCKDLETTLENNLLAAKEHDCNQQIKKQKTCVIVVDSSSEDEEETTKDRKPEYNGGSAVKVENKINEVGNLDDDFVKLQHELTQIKSKIKTTSTEIQQSIAKNKLLAATVQDAESEYLELKSQFENECRELNLENIQKQDTINERRRCIKELRNRKYMESPSDEDKENQNQLNFNE